MTEPSFLPAPVLTVWPKSEPSTTLHRKRDAPFVDKPENETVAFLNNTNRGISTGTLNRYSGELSLHIITPYVC